MRSFTMTSCCNMVDLSSLRSTMSSTMADLTATSTPVALDTSLATPCSRWMYTPRSLRSLSIKGDFRGSLLTGQSIITSKLFLLLLLYHREQQVRLVLEHETALSEKRGCLCNLLCLGVALSRLVPVWACLCCFAQSYWRRWRSGPVSHHHTETRKSTTTKKHTQYRSQQTLLTPRYFDWYWH